MKDTEKHLVSALLECMCQYQKENNVVRECQANTQLLLDILRGCKITGAKAKACMCTGREEQVQVCVDKHFVVEIDGEVFDPSYCINKLKDRSYYYNENECIGFINFMNEEIKTGNPGNWQGKLVSIKGYERFKQIAEKMNKNEDGVEDLQYYKNQKNYIMSQPQFKVV
jgi:hypothetical protein